MEHSETDKKIDQTYFRNLCARIEQENNTLHAFLPEQDRWERIEEAIKIHLTQKTASLPLSGIAAAIKDIFRIDGLPTKAGSKLPPEEFSGSEAIVVTKLKKAGAIIVGKTVTTEFAYAEPGETVHPLDHTYSPGGSSSGSAAAVAANLCTIALGSQTIGSTIRPASYCGIAALKCSHGRINTDGMIPFAPSLDSVGLFAREISTLETVAEILYNNWNNEATLSQQINFAVPAGPYLQQAEEEILKIFTAYAPDLINAGYSVQTVPVFDDIEEINALIWNIAAYETAAIHAEWYKKYKDLYSTKTREFVEKGQQISEITYKEMMQKKEALKIEIQTIMEKQQIDFWITPAATSFAPHTLTYTGDPAMNIPWTLSGMPAITLPMKTKSMPVGLQIISKMNRDEQLLQIGKKLERIIHDA